MSGETPSTIPRASFAKFSACRPDLVVLARLIGAAEQSLSLQVLRQNLSGLLTFNELAAVLDTLATKGDVSQGLEIEITRQGASAVKLALGSERIENWARTKATRLPLLALGLDPANIDVRRKFARADCLKAAVIAVSYDLSPQSMASTRAVCSELVWRLVGSLFPRSQATRPARGLTSSAPSNARYFPDWLARGTRRSLRSQTQSPRQLSA